MTIKKKKTQIKFTKTTKASVSKKTKSILAQLTEGELLQFIKADADVRIVRQEIITFDQKIEMEILKFNSLISDLQNRITQEQQRFEKEHARLREQRRAATMDADVKLKKNHDIVKSIAQKFSLDPQQLLIDIDTGLVSASMPEQTNSNQNT